MAACFDCVLQMEKSMQGRGSRFRPTQSGACHFAHKSMMRVWNLNLGAGIWMMKVTVYLGVGT